MVWLIAGLVLFLGIHSAGIVPGIRAGLVKGFGPGGYKVLYSLISITGFALIIYGAINAHPSETLWDPPAWTRSLALVAVPVSLILLISTYTPGHIRHAVRHPMMLGVFVWSGAHLIANGELASVVLFGSFFAWSVLSLSVAFAKGGAPSTPPGWGGDVTAVIVGALISAALARFHLYLFGVAVIG